MTDWPRLEVLTEHPIAETSPDHLHPWGTRHDNHRHDGFNGKLRRIVPPDRLSVLDLGCSGGGFVKDMVDAGHLGIGIEGSDFSKKIGRAEWATIPDNLFTADITKPFVVARGDYFDLGVVDPWQFGAVTLWDVIEHIAEQDLPPLMDNINRHLMPGGLVIMSICPGSETSSGVELHQTVRPAFWWDETFNRFGWHDNPDLVSWFAGDWVRNVDNAPVSFHVVLSRIGEQRVITEGLL